MYISTCKKVGRARPNARSALAQRTLASKQDDLLLDILLLFFIMVSGSMSWVKYLPIPTSILSKHSRKSEI